MPSCGFADLSSAMFDQQQLMNYHVQFQMGLRNTVRPDPVPGLTNPERAWTAAAAPSWFGRFVTVANLLVWGYAGWQFARQIGGLP